MRSRFMLLAVALPVLAAAPVHSQTSFTASGDVTWRLNTFNTPAFDFFLEAVNGQARRLLASENGTSIFVDTKGQVANTSFSGSLLAQAVDLGVFPTGTNLVFSLVAGGVTYSSTAYYRQVNATSFNLEYVSGTGTLTHPTEALANVILTGVTGIQNPVCTVDNPIQPCGSITQVTSTPEPASIALFATGLAGLLPVVIRRRRAASLS